MRAQQANGQNSFIAHHAKRDVHGGPMRAQPREGLIYIYIRYIYTISMVGLMGMEFDQPCWLAVASDFSMHVLSAAVPAAVPTAVPAIKRGPMGARVGPRVCVCVWNPLGFLGDSYTRVMQLYSIIHRLRED